MKSSRHSISNLALLNMLYMDSETLKTYQIVGDAEASIENNTISFTTPIARSLIKKELGEYVEVETPGGIKEYEITAIKLV